MAQGKGPRRALDSCRVLGHGWQVVPDDAAWSDRRVWNHRMVLRCFRCETVRYDGLDALGAVGHRHYVYPDSYRYPKDEVPSRGELRLRMLAPPGERRTRRRHLDVAGQGDAPGPQNGSGSGPHDHAGPVQAATAGPAA